MRPNNLRFVVLLLVALSGSAIAAPRQPAHHAAPKYPLVVIGKVTHVHDGDGCLIEDSAGQKWDLRYQGIDAPELEKRGGKHTWPTQPFGPQAQQANAALVLNQNCKVVVTGVAAWNRYQAIVFAPDGRDVRLTILAQGLAWVDARYSRDPALAQLEQLARQQKAGLWSDPHPINPADWRKGKRR